MFLIDPFKIGPALPLTEKQKAEQKLNEEWDKAGKPSLEQRIEDRDRIMTDAMKRAFEKWCRSLSRSPNMWQLRPQKWSRLASSS
jgi:hypothetical protein